MYKTFAGKYRSTVRKINKKYRLNKLFTVKYEQKEMCIRDRRNGEGNSI